MKKTDFLNETGQGLMEYSMAVVMVAVVAMVVLAVMAPGMVDMFTTIVQGF